MKWESDNTLRLIEESKKGNTRATEILVRENEPLVKSIIKRFLGRGIEYDDLFQIGNIGLLKAISGFNPDFSVRFSTYAVPMISGEVKRFVRDNNLIKMPRSLKELQQKIRYCRGQLTIEQGCEPTVEELAEKLNCTVEDIVLAIDSMNACASLDEPAFEEEGATKMDLLADKKDKGNLLDKIALRQCIDQLDEREKTVIFLRYYKDFTQTRISEILGISQVQISRIESRTIEKLKRKLG